jgi:hypothetical protein
VTHERGRIGAMERRAWTFELEDGRHVVELEHGCWLGQRRIHVDGRLVHQSMMLLDAGSEHPFRLGGHECNVIIRYRLLFSYDLLIDGEPVRRWRPKATEQPAELVPAEAPHGRGDELAPDAPLPPARTGQRRGRSW